MISELNTSLTSVLPEKNQLAKEKVVIIIPTYNEESVISETIHQIFDSVSSLNDFDVNILIFDSASIDKTQKVILELQKNYPRLYLEQEAQKSGLGSAYRQAMTFAMRSLHADIIFECDADLSHQPKYIAPMLEMLKTCDVVVGSRYVKGGSIPGNWGWHRKLFSILGNYVARGILTTRYMDFTSGFRATRCQLLKKILPEKFLSNHYAYKLQLLWLLHKGGGRIRELPIDFIDREKGESKLPKNSIIDSLAVVFTLRYRELKRYFKMCLVGLLGVFVQLVVYNTLRLYLTPFEASQLAVLAAIVNNFILNGYYTFKTRLKTRQQYKLRRLAGFTLYSLIMIYLQSFWLELGVSLAGSGAFRENMILAIGILLGSLLNYFVYSRHIWPEPKTASL